MRIGPATRRRGVRRVLASAIAAMIVGGAGAAMGTAPVSAATPSVIVLSPDGVVWSTSLAGGLFDSFQGAVPGDTVTQSFFVKNPRSTPVTMRTRAMDVRSSDSDFDSAITVDGAAGGHTLAAAVPLTSLADCATLAPDLVVAAHGVVKVSMTLAMLDVDGSYAQAASGGFDVLLSMQDAQAGTGGTSCDSPDPGAGVGGGANHPTTASGPTATGFGPLAFTGADIAVPLFAAGMLFAAGFLLLIARRRRRERKES